VTLFVDLDESRLLFATETRGRRRWRNFEQLERHGGRAQHIREFCLYMWPAYLKGIRDSFPEAGLTFDKFHVMKLLNEAVVRVRRQEQRDRPELKCSRYVWTTNPETLTPTQFSLLDALDVKS
jgi:transposase